ncbi:acyl-CoA thioesterase/BAAT N-terminal domain-containing protein [Leifsonia sp. NPDC058230]|uniref:acyl-CoA thioesterase/bile acid-CoA:amino acid N-acyltransferase family protein n=1 Tax=Leifsonia sp. NPDC058230 TaxID=3346391 RepID=UPI0036DF6304
MTRPRTWARVAAAAVAAALVVGLTGCGSAGGLGSTRFVVTQLRSGITDPLAISVLGLQAGQPLVLTATAETESGRYHSRAVYAVPPDGEVDLWNARPLLAPYSKPDPAGLIWNLDGPSQSQGELETAWASDDLDIRLTAVQSGRQVAATTVRRTGFAHQVSTRAIFAGDLIRTTAGGSPGGTTYDVRIGTYYEPDPDREVPRPAVVLIDGDEAGGSAAFVAAQLAANGFSTFVLPAFGPEGQIPGSAALSVESFDLAISWLRLQPSVDSDRIFTYGTWRASQLALWFASNRPQQIYGAIAASGTTALLCTSAALTPVLTADGLPVPCEDPSRTIADTAQLRLDRIRGTVLLACGEKDEILANACDWLAAGRAVRGERPGDVFHVAPGAGHSISTPPIVPVGLQGLSSATAQATEDARVAFWARAIEMLQAASR